MRITLFQTDIYWADKMLNLAKTESELEKISGYTDLVVLPELFTTGFCVDKLELAETMSGESVQTLVYWAKKFNLALTGSFMAAEKGKIFNRSFFAFPNGEIKTADKRHLFSMGGEDKYFSAGNSKLLVNYRGFNIRVLVCYDIRFPVWARNVKNEYDLLIYVANFPEKRIDAWDALLKARAIENQAYVCGVNIIGKDGKEIDYSGHSVLRAPNGKKILECAENKEQILTAEINIKDMNDFRDKFAFWKDADDFEIKK